MTPIADPITRAAHDFRACAESIAQAARVMRSAMPQTYTLKDLHNRYHGVPHQTLVTLLTSVCGYQPGRGKRPVFHLDQVLGLDEAIRLEVNIRHKVIA